MENKILGADKEIVERMLILIRDKYAVANTANYFLEHRAGVAGTTIGMSNLRDVLSHLSTLLGGPDGSLQLDLDQQKAQLNNAEEHFRRAVYEPYEHAANEAVIKLDEDIKRYQKIVLRRGEGYVRENHLYSEDQLNARKAAIADLRTEARSAKATNLWNTQWEESVKKLMQAYEAIILFQSDLDKASNKVEGDAGYMLSKGNLILAILFFIITIFLTWLITKVYA